MNKTIKHQISLNASPEMVWAYLASPDFLERWLMKNTFRPIAGTEFQFITNPIPALDFDGIFYCRLLEIIPFENLSYSWQSGPGNSEITLSSIVIWQLRPSETGTNLLLEHSGFANERNDPFYNSLSQGWAELLQKLKGLLQTEK